MQKNKDEKRKFVEPTLTKEASLVQATLQFVLVSGKDQVNGASNGAFNGQQAI